MRTNERTESHPAPRLTPQQHRALVHDYIDPEVNGRSIRAACGDWIRSDDEKRHRHEPVTCPDCRRIRDAFEHMEI